MLAARVQNRQDHQIRVGEQPFLRLGSRCLGGAREEPQMLRPGQAPHVVQADARQPGHFVLGEEPLAGFDRDHGKMPLNLFDAAAILMATPIFEQ